MQSGPYLGEDDITRYEDVYGHPDVTPGHDPGRDGRGRARPRGPQRARYSSARPCSASRWVCAPWSISSISTSVARFAVIRIACEAWSSSRRSASDVDHHVGAGRVDPDRVAAVDVAEGAGVVVGEDQRVALPEVEALDGGGPAGRAAREVEDVGGAVARRRPSVPPSASDAEARGEVRRRAAAAVDDAVPVDQAAAAARLPVVGDGPARLASRGTEGAVLPMIVTSVEIVETLMSGMLTTLVMPQSRLWMTLLLRMRQAVHVLDADAVHVRGADGVVLDDDVLVELARLPLRASALPM